MSLCIRLCKITDFSRGIRVEILEEAAVVAKEAVLRLADKLQSLIDAAGGQPVEVEIGEEFRLLTLQVIGQTVLSLKPEESDKVFPQLYLPIVEEANARTWYPYRWVPSFSTLSLYLSYPFSLSQGIPSNKG